MAIYDTKAEYGKKLARYINEQEPMFEAQAFSDSDIFASYLKNNNVELALVKEDSSYLVDEYKNMLVMLLREDDSELKDSIGRYTPAKEVVKRLKEYCNGVMAEKQDICQSIAVYSPTHIMARDLYARDICKSKADSLLINFTEYDPFGIRADKCVEKDLDKYFLFAISQHKEDILHTLEQDIISKDGINMVLTPLNYWDIRALSNKDIIWFIDRIKASNKYGAIVFNISGGIMANIECITCFDKIYIVSDEGKTYNEADIKSVRDSINYDANRLFDSVDLTDSETSIVWVTV